MTVFVRMAGPPAPVPPRQLLPRNVVGRLDVRTVGRRRSGHRDELLVIGLGGGAVAELLSGLSRAGKATEAVRLLGFGGVERRQCFLRHAVLQKHLAIELTRRSERAGCDGRLVGLVLGIGRGAHRLPGLIGLALGVEQPGVGDLPLDIDLLGPIAVLRLAELVAQLGEHGDVGLGGARISRSAPRRARGRNA